MLRIEPELPMLRIEPALPMLRMEPALPRLNSDRTLMRLPKLIRLNALSPLATLRRLRQPASTKRCYANSMVLDNVRRIFGLRRALWAVGRGRLQRAVGRWFSRQPLVRFGVIALVPVLVLGVLMARALNSDIQQRYLETARTSATILSQVGIQPLFTESQMTGGLTPESVFQVDFSLQGAAVSTEVDRIKVWNRQGTIVYSDNHSLIGKTFPIDDDLDNALHGQSSASITSGQDSENAGDTLSGPLIQVYVPLIFKGDDVPSGAFELYLPYAPVQAAIDSESRQLYFLLAAGLTLFYVSMFPVAFIAIRWQRRAEAAAMANLATLERLNKLKSDFLVRISHQFRTAMVGIEGFTELMRDSDHLELDEVKAYARDIHDDAERLDRAFEKMVEIDQADSSAAPVDLNALIGDAIGRETAQKR